jgi:uncharacterized membrane protein
MRTHFESKKIVYISIGFSVLLVGARIIYSGEMHYVFICWNLFLAWVPFVLSNILRLKQDAALWFQAVLLFGWLIFFPNAPYIITDFLHLGESPKVPLWFDVLLLFTASWNGLLLGILSLFQVEKFLEEKFNSRFACFCILLFIFLSGFGVYAGRYLRWNSWEVFTDPQNIIQDTAIRVLNPLEHPTTWGLTVLLGSLLSIIYFTLKNLKTRDV